MSLVSKTTKVVLITGANQGLGFEIAKSLASKTGYHILMGSRNPERGTEAASKLQKQGITVESVTIDVTSDDSIEKTVSDITSKFGRLDVLINNAGVALPEEGSEILGATVDPASLKGARLRSLYQDIFNVNTFGAALTTEAFLPLLSESSAPRIVFLSTSLGSLTLKATDPHHASLLLPIYRSSKAALNLLMLHYAEKYKEAGWKINACCPGYCSTNLNSYNGLEMPENGAKQAVRLATLAEDGETGTYSDKNGTLPW